MARGARGHAPVGVRAVRVAIGAFLASMVAACQVIDIGVPNGELADAAPAGFPECAAERYDFVGEGTLSGLGLDKATPVPPPEPNRPAKIWVTHDLLPHDFGEPGGPVEMTRMLCFEFADGSGGSGWPVDPDWQPPARPAVDPGNAPNDRWVQILPIVGIVTVVAIASALAFRGRRASRRM